MSQIVGFNPLTTVILADVCIMEKEGPLTVALTVKNVLSHVVRLHTAAAKSVTENLTLRGGPGSRNYDITNSEETNCGQIWTSMMWKLDNGLEPTLQ